MVMELKKVMEFEKIIVHFLPGDYMSQCWKGGKPNEIYTQTQAVMHYVAMVILTIFSCYATYVM